MDVATLRLAFHTAEDRCPPLLAAVTDITHDHPARPSIRWLHSCPLQSESRMMTAHESQLTSERFLIPRFSTFGFNISEQHHLNSK
jgi:hypothetical protein